MAGYIGTQAVSVNTTSATISDDLSVGDDALITGTLTTTAATVFSGGFASNDGSTISTADNTTQLTLISTDADSSAGPVMEFYRNSSSPADNDSTGLIYFTGENDADEKVFYGQIFTQIKDASNGTEDASIDFITMVAGTGRSRMLLAPTETVFNEASVDLDFRVESNGNANMLFVDAGNDVVSIGTQSFDARVGQPFCITTGGGTDRGGMSISAYGPASAAGPLFEFNVSRNPNPGSHTVVADGDALGTIIFRGDDGDEFVDCAFIECQVDGTPGNGDMPGRLKFGTSPDGTGGMEERMRIDDAGNVMVAKTAANNTSVGHVLYSSGFNAIVADGGTCLMVNRLTNDGALVSIRQANSEEGTISVSGGTVSYNAFSGSHWSRLTDNSQPTILKGTLIETIDEMCDWYQAQFTIPATTRVNEDGDTVEVDAAHTSKESIALPDGASVGDAISHISNGVTYSAAIVKEGDNKHPKCKISDTADSTRIYGVFAAWDNDDDTVNDMYVTAVGTHVVRVHGGQTVSAGDLLVSNGDGTAKVQDDDIIRSKTLGKVLTNIKQETYADDSYTVPCALYCG